MKLITKFIPQTIIYTGHELRSHWIYEQIHEFGSALIAFQGPCNVATSELVDLEDASKGDFIAAKNMLHFVGEFFGENLEVTILKQRLFAAVCTDALRKILPLDIGVGLQREGDDIYYLKDGLKKKFSVSIATATPVSTLLHFGININAEGAPVEAIGLDDLSVSVKRLVDTVFETWHSEMESQYIARAKVVPR